MSEAPHPPLPRPSADTRALILDAARHRFSRQGRDGVTMRQIAADTGLTMPTLYHHFVDKAGLYEACVASVVDDAERALRAAFEATPEPAERVRSVTVVLCALLIGNPWLLPFLQHESALGTRPLDKLVPPDILQELNAALAQGAADDVGVLSPARRLVAYAYGYAAFARSLSLEGAGRQDVARLADTLLAAARTTATSAP